MAAEWAEGCSGRRAKVSVVILVCMLVGCRGGSNSSADHRRVTDDIGREVLVPAKPSKVISLAPSITEVIFAAGAEDHLAAVTTADNYPLQIESIHKVTAFPLDHEGIVALGPDLILATDQINSIRDVDALSELGLPSYFLRFVSAADVFAAVRTVGRLLGTERQAEETADSLQALWQGYFSGIDTTSYLPSVLLLAGYDILYAFGRDSYTNEIIRAAGGRSVTEELDGQAATLSDEFVLTEQPDVIVGTFGDDFDVGMIIAAHPTWTEIPAVKNGNVYSINPDLISRPGPRILEGAAQIKKWVANVHSPDEAS